MKPQIIRARPWIYKVTSTVSACAKSSEKPKFVIHLRRKRICVYQEERNTRFFISNTRDHPHSKYAQKSIKLEPSPPLYAIRRIWINPPPPTPPMRTYFLYIHPHLPLLINFYSESSFRHSQFISYFHFYSEVKFFIL